MLHRPAQIVFIARCRGLTLTELLVATTLLSSATAGGLAAFSRAHAARSDAGRLQQLHERAQYVFASLEPELQMAGYFGGDTPPAPLPVASIPEPAQRCGVDLIRRLDLPVQALAEWSLACDARGGGAVAGSDVLVVRRAAARPAPVAQAGRAQWLSPAPPSTGGQLHWHGDAPPHAAANGQVRELIVRLYYVAGSADGEPGSPALRVKSLTSIAGVPAFIDTEVMPGVEGMQIALLPTPAAPQAVRLQLRFRADAPEPGTSNPPGTLEVSRYFWLRNARR